MPEYILHSAMPEVGIDTARDRPADDEIDPAFEALRLFVGDDSARVAARVEYNVHDGPTCAGDVVESLVQRAQSKWRD